MERRRAVIAAATAALTLLAGGAAISLNSAIVGASGGDGPGQISPVDTGTESPATVTVDPTPSSGVTSGRSVADPEDEELEGTRAGTEHEYEGADDDD